MNAEPGISLICATRNRTTELRRLMESLCQQSNKNFELILVDQNENLIEPLVAEFAEHLNLQHTKQTEANNSKARNLGATIARYTWLGFPDDDCWYPPDFIANLHKELKADRAGLFINWSDPLQQPTKTRFQFTEGAMSQEEAFALASCICLFVERTTFARVGGFNEKLGLGSDTLLKAGEEQELTLRVLQSGNTICKVPRLFVHHQMHERVWDKEFEKRIASQGACDYLFTKKFVGSIRATMLLGTWLAAVLYNLLRLKKQNRRWYWLKLKGALTAPNIV
ncbi:MAG: glycosyltransferase family 2 protein [Cytophagales bacterium]|nr:glycosyltransferase family 2 protein [Cytophagales bacterium]